MTKKTLKASNDFALLMGKQEKKIKTAKGKETKAKDAHRVAIMQQYITLMLHYSQFDSAGSGGNNELTKTLAKEYKAMIVDAGVELKTANRYQETALAVIGITSEPAKKGRKALLPDIIEACKVNESDYEKRRESLSFFLFEKSHTLEGRGDSVFYNSQAKLISLRTPPQSDADKAAEIVAKKYHWLKGQSEAVNSEFNKALAKYAKAFDKEDAAKAKEAKDKADKEAREAANDAKTESGPVTTIPVPAEPEKKPARRTRKPAAAKVA